MLTQNECSLRQPYCLVKRCISSWTEWKKLRFWKFRLSNYWNLHFSVDVYFEKKISHFWLFQGWISKSAEDCLQQKWVPPITTDQLSFLSWMKLSSYHKNYPLQLQILLFWRWCWSQNSSWIIQSQKLSEAEIQNGIASFVYHLLLFK